MWNKINRDDFFSNTLVIAATELIMMLGGMEIMTLFYMPIIMMTTTTDEMKYEFITYGVYYVAFLIPIGICLLYMRYTKPEKLKIFTKGGWKGFCRNVALGLLIGFVMNGLISVLVGVSGTVSYSFHTFTWYMPACAVLAFIQCSCEEVLLRGYASSYMEDRHDWSAAAFMSGVPFIFHHIRNMEMYGFDAMFCLNVFLAGVIAYLLVKLTGNFWTCCGFHTGWNVTQMYLFGLPNSGISSAVALFQGNEAKDTFFFNTVYGNEGSWCTTIIFLIGIAVILYLWKRKDLNKSV